MKSKATCISVLVRFVMFSVFLSGCTESQITDTSGKEPVVKATIAEKVHVIDVRSYQRGPELVISGTVKRSYNFCCDDAKGHIDIVVVDPDGFVLGAASAYHSPRNIPKNRTRSAKFEATLPITLPKGAVIRTAYHSNSDFADYATGTRTLHCRLNMATPGIDAL